MAIRGIDSIPRSFLPHDDGVTTRAVFVNQSKRFNRDMRTKIPKPDAIKIREEISTLRARIGQLKKLLDLAEIQHLLPDKTDRAAAEAGQRSGGVQ